MKIHNDSHGEAGRKRRIHSAHEFAKLRVEPRFIGRWVRALLHRNEEGSALVEIALVTPVLMAVITGICSFAVGFNNQLTLTSAVGAGAQYLQVIRSTTSDPCADALTAIKAAAPSLKASSIQLSLAITSITTTGTTSTTETGNSCTSGAALLTPQEPVTVSATYPCALAIYGTTFTNKCQLSAQVTEYEY
jgi:Flp pilus assembly protein TadG